MNARSIDATVHLSHLRPWIRLAGLCLAGSRQRRLRLAADHFGSKYELCERRLDLLEFTMAAKAVNADPRRILAKMLKLL